MEESNFASLNREISDNISDTEVPLLVNVILVNVPNLRQQSLAESYWFFFDASFKLGRITDCDPKVGKNLM